MSYSFNVRAATKDAALVALAIKFDETVVASQPVHQADRQAVLDNASSAVGLLADDDTRDVSISVNGYLSWSGIDQKGFTGASVCCQAGYMAREQAPV